MTDQPLRRKTVTLIKGTHIPPRVWEDSPERAMQRAAALEELHGATVTEDRNGFVVDAAHYYRKANAKAKQR
jgi:hypothetical protein